MKMNQNKDTTCIKCENLLTFDPNRNEYYCLECDQYFPKKVIEKIKDIEEV